MRPRKRVHEPAQQPRILLSVPLFAQETVRYEYLFIPLAEKVTELAGRGTKFSTGPRKIMRWKLF